MYADDHTLEYRPFVGATAVQMTQIGDTVCRPPWTEVVLLRWTVRGRS